MKQPKSLAVSTFRAAVNVTKGSGRRFVICPSCSVIGAPVPLDATALTCRHCGADIALTAKSERPKRDAAPQPCQSILTPETHFHE